MGLFHHIALGALCATTLANAALVKFSVDIRSATQAPDGFSRQVITINGTTPGPTLTLNQFDNVEFLVRNYLSNATTIHFHGIEQLNTPWSDGVPGLSQKPIPPGGQFLYKWTATEYGTYWYHAHYHAQIKDGQYGGIYVRPCPTQVKPFSKISTDVVAQALMTAAETKPNLVMVSDWQHVTSEQNDRIQNASNIENYCAQSVLINGKGRVTCLSPAEQSAAFPPPFKAIYNGTLEPNGCLPFGPVSFPGYTINTTAIPRDLIVGCKATTSPEAEFVVNSASGWASFNFINTGSILGPIVSIDEHPMWLYAVDGRYVDPVLINGITVLNGERYSVMIQLNKTPKTYKLRASNFGLNQLIGGTANVRYQSSSSLSSKVVEIAGIPSIPAVPKRRSPIKERRDLAKRAESQPYYTYGGFPTSPTVITLNSTMIHPLINIPPKTVADETYVLEISRLNPPFIYTLNDNTSYPSFPIEYAENAPLLYFPNSTDGENEKLVIRTKNGSWVDLVMTVADMGGPSHPMHKHSNKGYAIGQGMGPWKWKSVAEAAAEQPQNFNFVNPQYRDQFVTAAAMGTPTWSVVRYQVVNPGAFLFHCHIQGHLSGGMAVALLDGIDKFPTAPCEYGASGNGVGPCK